MSGLLVAMLLLTPSPSWFPPPPSPPSFPPLLPPPLPFLSRRRDAGMPVEYGVNYSAIRYMRERKLVKEEEADRLEAGEIPAPRSLPFEVLSSKST
jgi:hypothetical protein